MTGLATAQTTVLAADVQPGQYLYSWRQMRWAAVTAPAVRDGRLLRFPVEGQPEPISCDADAYVEVCAP